MATDLVPLSPEWWLKSLYERLAERQDEIEFYTDYYTGNHPLPWLAPQAEQEFRRILEMTRSNYMGLVCDAMVERIQIEGFRFGDQGEADKDIWRIFQANNLDADSDMSLLEAAICGQSYLQVAPNEEDSSTPHIWVEHASQVIVAYEPGTNRRNRLAGLKVWDDEWTGEIHATLQLPDGIHKYRADAQAAGSAGRMPEFTERNVEGEQGNGHRPNPLGMVSIVEIPNNPQLLTGGVSELADVTDIQDRINKTLADRLMTQDYGAFPQKWASGWPEEDDEGNPTPGIDIGRNRMVTTEVTETRFGQWDAAPMDPYSVAKREDVKDIASRTRTPAQYLLGEMSNVNGETLKASESGLVSKVRQRRRAYAEAYEEAMRIARIAAGMSNGDGSERMETIFSNPEFRTEGELADATVKKLQAGIISRRQAREDLGYTATQIDRMEQQDAEEAEDPTITRLMREVASTPTTGATTGNKPGPPPEFNSANSGTGATNLGG